MTTRLFPVLPARGRLDHLPKCELLGVRYPQESNSKNNVCQGINVTEKVDNRICDRDFGPVELLDWYAHS